MIKATVCILLVLFAFAGCNILSWTHTKEESHIDRGLELMRQGRYTEAETEFAQAMEENPNSAEARYYHAKATLSGAQFDTIDLVKEISQAEIDRTADGAQLPLCSKETDVLNEMYQVNAIIVDDLRPIYDGVTYGTITAGDIDIDMAVASVIVALLGLRDTNRDSAITDEDLILDISYSAIVEEYSIVGLHQFLGEGHELLRTQCSSPSVSPEDINPLIDYVLSLIVESEDILVGAVKSWTTGLSDDNIRALLAEVRTMVVKYYYDDDRDNDNDVMIDEETLNGRDDDGDGLTDEDTDRV